jgi:hypothetical protein
LGRSATKKKEKLANINSINIEINKILELSNSHAITFTWNVISCFSNSSVPFHFSYFMFISVLILLEIIRT